MASKKRQASDEGRGTSKVPVAPERRVWRIFHFTERFELPEDIKICRKSGLQYTKRFVGVAAGDEAVGYHRQLGILCNGDGQEVSMLKGLYGDLVDMAAEQSYAKRGYLLDADSQPLTSAQIAKLLNYKAPVMRRLLKRFESVKLLERVELPAFDLSKNEKAGQSKRTKKKSLRNVPENSEKTGAPLKNDKRQTAKGKQRATHGLTAVVAKNKNKDKNNNNDTRERPTGRSSPGQGQGPNPTASAPTTAPPLPSEPHASDDGGRQRSKSFARPPGSADISSAGLVYGRRVYLALRYLWDIDSPEAAREIASFASKHDELCRRLSPRSPPQIDAQLMRGLSEAAKIAGRKANKNKGAVWNTAMSHIIAKHEKK